MDNPENGEYEAERRKDENTKSSGLDDDFTSPKLHDEQPEASHGTMFSNSTENPKRQIQLAVQNRDIGRLQSLLATSEIDTNDYEQSMYSACREGYKEGIKALLGRPDLWNWERRGSPLHFACWRCEPTVIHVLLEHPGIDINAAHRTHYGLTPLHYACIRGDFAIIKMLLDQPGISTSARDDNDFLPIHFVISKGLIASYRLQEGFHREALWWFPTTGDVWMPWPKHQAEEDEMAATCIESLLQALTIEGYSDTKVSRYLNIDLPMMKVCTPLHLAAFFGNAIAMKVLLRHVAHGTLKVNIHARTQPLGYNALHLAVSSSSSANANQDHYPIANLLLDHGIMVKAQDSVYQETALHLAVKLGRHGMVQLLLDRTDCDLDPNLSDRNGCTPLHVAINMNDTMIIRMLLRDPRVDVDARDGNGCTSLHLAVRSWALETVRILLEAKKCNVAAKDSKGDTPLHTAVRVPFTSSRYLQGTAREEMIKKILKAGGSQVINERNKKKETALDCHMFLPFQNGETFRSKSRIYQLLIDHGAVANLSRMPQSGNGDTLFHEAARHDNDRWRIKIIHHLLKLRIGPVLNTVNHFGETVLHIATRTSSPDEDEYWMDGGLRLRDLLLQKGMDFRIRDIEGLNVLDYLSANGGNRSAAIKILLDEVGVDVNSHSTQGWTALHHAAVTGHVQNVEMLLQKGADRSLLTIAPTFATAESLAQENSRTDIADLIETFRNRDLDTNLRALSPPESEASKNVRAWTWPIRPPNWHVNWGRRESSTNAICTRMVSVHDLIYDTAQATELFWIFEKHAYRRFWCRRQISYPRPIKQWQLRPSICRTQGWDFNLHLLRPCDPDPDEDAGGFEINLDAQYSLERKLSQWVHLPANNVSTPQTGHPSNSWSSLITRLFAPADSCITNLLSETLGGGKSVSTSPSLSSSQDVAV